jgi:hypothetical protein
MSTIREAIYIVGVGLRSRLFLPESFHPLIFREVVHMLIWQ